MRDDHIQIFTLRDANGAEIQASINPEVNDPHPSEQPLITADGEYSVSPLASSGMSTRLLGQNADPEYISVDNQRILKSLGVSVLEQKVFTDLGGKKYLAVKADKALPVYDAYYSKNPMGYPWNRFRNDALPQKFAEKLESNEITRANYIEFLVEQSMLGNTNANLGNTYCVKGKDGVLEFFASEVQYVGCDFSEQIENGKKFHSKNTSRNHVTNVDNTLGPLAILREKYGEEFKNAVEKVSKKYSEPNMQKELGAINAPNPGGDGTRTLQDAVNANKTFLKGFTEEKAQEITQRLSENYEVDLAYDQQQKASLRKHATTEPEIGAEQPKASVGDERVHLGNKRSAMFPETEQPEPSVDGEGKFARKRSAMLSETKRSEPSVDGKGKFARKRTAMLNVPEPEPLIPDTASCLPLPRSLGEASEMMHSDLEPATAAVKAACRRWREIVQKPEKGGGHQL